jgi:hypothetical protein
VEGQFTAVRLASVSLSPRENVSKSEAAAIRHEAAVASTGESKPEREPLANEAVRRPPEQSNLLITPTQKTTATTTGQSASNAPTQRVAALPQAGAQINPDTPAPAEAHAQRLESTFTDRQSDSAQPVQSADTAAADRRAVFADMAKNDSDPRFLPVLLPEHRRAELIGLAVAVVAGQPLLQKWRRRFAKDVRDINDEMLPR